MTEKYRVEKIKLATERQRYMKKETVQFGWRGMKRISNKKKF